MRPRSRSSGFLGSHIVGAGTFAAAAAFPRLVSLVLLPIYLTALTQEEYGQVSMVIALAALVQPIVGMGIDTATFRRLTELRGDPEATRAFFNTVAPFVLVVSPLVAVALGIVAGVLATTSGGVALVLPVAFMGVALYQSSLSLPLAFLRAHERTRAYFTVSVAYAATNAALLLLGVVALGGGVLAWFSAALVASTVLLIAGFATIGHSWRLESQAGVLRMTLAFGLPMVPHAVAHWALQSSDRLLLGAFTDAATVATYNLAYQFALPASLLAVAINQSVMPRYVRLGRDGGSLGSTIADHVILVTIACLATAVVMPGVLIAVAPASYAEAASLVPVISIGLMLFGWYLIPMDRIILVAGTSRWVWPFTAVAALANVLLNLLLIPALGTTAAALNTVIGYLFLLVTVHLYARRVDRQPRLTAPAGTIVRVGLLVGVAIVVLFAVPASWGLVSSIARGVPLLVVGALVLWHRTSSPVTA